LKILHPEQNFEFFFLETGAWPFDQASDLSAAHEVARALSTSRKISKRTDPRLFAGTGLNCGAIVALPNGVGTFERPVIRTWTIKQGQTPRTAQAVYFFFFS
jgi:hypothetical protein